MRLVSLPPSATEIVYAGIFRIRTAADGVRRPRIAGMTRRVDG
jgi:hypothetical protein